MAKRKGGTSPQDSGRAYSYMELIHCTTPEEVYERVREWSSALSDHEHLVRSTILDIHANIESRLKQILYQALQPLIFNGDDSQEHEAGCNALDDQVRTMSFAQVHNLLKPALNAYPADEFNDIGLLNSLRNDVTHRGAPPESGIRRVIHLQMRNVLRRSFSMLGR